MKTCIWYYGNKPSPDNINTLDLLALYQFEKYFSEMKIFIVVSWLADRPEVQYCRYWYDVSCSSSWPSPWWSASVWLPPPAGPSGKVGCGTFLTTTMTTSRGSEATTTLSTGRRNSVLSIQQIPAVEMCQFSLLSCDNQELIINHQQIILMVHCTTFDHLEGHWNIKYKLLVNQYSLLTHRARTGLQLFYFES